MKDTQTDIQDEILAIIDTLITRMGINGYCRWLAAETPVDWLTVTPYAEIRNVLAAQLSALAPTDRGGEA